MHRRASGCHTATTAKTAAVVMVLGMVMVRNGVAAAASPSRSRESADLLRLWERVTSHTETLRNINYYLKQTDIFWTWFQENKGRLDEILSEDRSSPSPDNDRLLQRLDELERKQKTRDEELQEMRTVLQEEKEKTDRLEARLQRYQGQSQDMLTREIPNLQEGIKQLETQLVAVNQTTLGNKRDIDGLQQDTNNLTRDVNKSQSASSDEVNALRGLLQDVMMNTVFPLEDKMMQLNKSQLALSEETNQRFTDVKDQIRSLSRRPSPKQGNNRRSGLQDQITTLQTNLSRVQDKIGELDGRISSFENTISQQDQLQKLSNEQSKIKLNLSRLENASGHMNLEIKATMEDVSNLERDVAHLKQYSNLTDHVRTLRIPTSAAASMHPIGPPGSNSSDRPSYPGRRALEGGLRRPGNQGWRGEPGDPGSRGAPGTPGAPGSPGSRGEQGRPGAPGGRGAPGSPGLRGEQGSPGAPGNRGAPGIPGSSGARGSPGVSGNTGLRGPPGSSGMRGPTGAQGLRGAPRSPGAPGMPGRRGAPGDPGYSGSPEYTGYPGSRWYANTSPAYAGYSASSGYAGYPSTSGYGRHYQG